MGNSSKRRERAKTRAKKQAAQKHARQGKPTKSSFPMMDYYLALAQLGMQHDMYSLLQPKRQQPPESRYWGDS